MQVITLPKKDKKRAAQVAASAFFNYPSLEFYFPDADTRTRKLPWYMERVLNSAFAYGDVLATDDLSGILFFLPPGHTRLTDWDYVKCGFLFAPLVVGLKRYSTVNECESYLAEVQENLLGNRPHYYLWGLTVDPNRQRTGAGKALLHAFYARADREQMPIYLETHKRENIAYYESRGFTLIHADVVPKHNQEFWCFLREPTPPQA